ncbi:MAG: class I SAM-dependent methyltransferase [Candidatus Latescibacterota bacterium]|nr:MAG: class I SAM-dependent methyltransferase [Candidatus Latescibacterota bacterium]
MDEMILESQLEELRRYYANHAQEYENIYYRDNVKRNEELKEISGAVERVCRGRRVLEVACGTGYWTEVAARDARSIVATDVSTEMLELAGRKDLPANKVEFRQVDAFALEGTDGDFDAGLACFWFSHVPKSRTNDFLTHFHDRLGKGAIVFMVDNMYARGYGGELIRRPNTPDTFKRRRLSDGSTYEILKNYYDPEELERIFSHQALDLEIHDATFYWWLSYVVK